MVRRYNETTKKWQIKLVDLEYGVVYADDNYIEFGYFDRKCADKIVLIDQNNYCCMKGISADWLIYSNYDGFYIPKRYISEDRIKFVRHKKGQGNFPYSFERKYEAIENFDIFKNKHVVDSNIQFRLSKYMPYTFGLEFETSMGYIPQEKCFEDGLIPLRDGSITGPEYSTVVMQGNKGINLLYQQLETLRKYTHFNKECALHIHLGGYPVNRAFIFTLYSLCYYLESDFVKMTNRDVFNTGRYKETGKDYCLPLDEYASFPSMFRSLVGTEYKGCLTNVHPNDAERNQKWHIHSRYKAVNFINMLCYKSPKTVEFRFLRPTYNFTKIYTWLLLFSAILKYAESFTKRFGECSCKTMYEKASQIGIKYDLRSICKSVYSSKVSSALCDRILELQTISASQRCNKDFSGSDVTFENELMTFTFR